MSAAPIVSGASFPAALSIAAPSYALAGGSTAITGSYHFALRQDPPLVAEQVQLFVDGAAAGSDPLVVGSFSVAHVFPARGVYSLHAVADAGKINEATSPVITIKAADLPTPPQDVVAIPLAGAVRVQLSWDVPVDDGGSPITGYDIARRDTPNHSWVPWATLPATARSYAQDVAFNTPYLYRVTAKGVVGKSAPADVPVTGAPPLPPVVTATPVHNSATVNIQVQNGGGPTQQLELERAYPGSGWIRLKLATGAAMSFADSVAPGLFPEYRATARSIVGDSDPTVVSPSGALPGAPTSVAAAVPERVEITWAAPAGGGAVQAYRVLEDGLVLGVVPYHTLSFALTTTPGDHDYAVIATSAAGDGVASAPANLVLAAASAPGLTGLVIEETHWGRANLLWTAPADDGGAPVLEYQVWRAPGPSNGPRARIATLNESTFSFNDGQLNDGRTYTYEVYAVTAAGKGATSEFAAVVSDFAWALDHGLSHFRVCEGTSCTNVPSNGSYDRTGTGSVSYAAVYAGVITRKGVPMGGEALLVDIWETSDPDGEMTDGRSVTTDAAGAYTAEWTRPTAITPSSCTSLGFRSRAWNGFTPYVMTLDTFTVCP